MRFLDKEDAQAVFSPIFERAWLEYPAMIRRDNLAWEAAITDPDGLRSRAPALFYAVYEIDGGGTGYVMYRIRHGVTAGDSTNSVQIHELVASDDEATAALWRFCFDIDLASTLTVGHGATTCLLYTSPSPRD